MAETLTAGPERAYLGDFFDRIAFNLGAFGPEVVDHYAAADAAPGGMKAGFEVYRAFDQDVEDNAALLKSAGRLQMPTLFVAGAESLGHGGRSHAQGSGRGRQPGHRTTQRPLPAGRKPCRLCGRGP